MINRETAEQLAQALLHEEYCGDASDEHLVIKEATEKFTHGWVIYWQSRSYLETEDIGCMLAGNAPILVDESDKSLHYTGTAYSSDYYVQNYLDTGDIHTEAIPAVLLSGWKTGAKKTEATRLINRSSSLGLAKSKTCIDKAIEGIPTSIQTETFQNAEKLATGLQSLNWKATVERRAPTNKSHGLD